MLASSSNLALSSTSATTCLPSSAARINARMIGLSCVDVRYIVCLIARTAGSRAACSTNASTEEENES